MTVYRTRFSDGNEEVVEAQSIAEARDLAQEPRDVGVAKVTTLRSVAPPDETTDEEE